MKKFIYILTILLLAASCTDVNPYEDRLVTMTVKTHFPDGYTGYDPAALTVLAEDMNTGSRYMVPADASGKAVLSLQAGLYRIAVTGMYGQDIFNGMTDRISAADSDLTLDIHMTYSKAGVLVIKEIYNGGCKKLPLEGTYQGDKYFILHNNDDKVQYLDGVCFGMLSPYNSTGSNPWVSKDPVTGESIFPDFLPVLQTIWQFPGSGSDFPLQPGEDAVVCINGAIDHSAEYPLSVNLNHPDYFVCYNDTYFTNTSYHPTPGDKISQDRYMSVVVNMGKGTAYAFSVSSPTLVIFKAEGMTMHEHISNVGITPVPGSNVDNVVKIPFEWVMDAVEVFDARSANNQKRLPPVMDAGYSLQTDVYLGRSHMRKVNEAMTIVKGYEVLTDTNNSLNDFYETEKQSLHE